MVSQLNLILSLVLLSSFLFSLCDTKAAFAWGFSGEVAKDGVSSLHNVTVGQVLGSSTFSFNSSHPVSVCIRRHLAPEKNVSKWNGTCHFFFSYISEYPNPSILLLPPAQYYVSVNASTANTTFSGSISATICDDGYYGPNCDIQPTVLTGQTLHLDTQAQYFLFPLLNDTVVYQNVTFRSSLKRKAAKIGGAIRKGFLPDEGDTEGQQAGIRFTQTFNSSWTLESPSFGNWLLSLQVLSLSSQVATDMNVTISICPAAKAGPNCTDIGVLDSSTPGATVETTADVDVFKYFSYNVTKENENFGFSFFVQLNRELGSAPALYLRKGQVPTEDFYDVVVNNPVFGNATGINFFESSAASHGLWYVGVKGTGQGFGLWFNAPCPNNCSDYGQCVSRDGHYTCVCNDLYERYDCSYRQDLKGFRKPYLVITIMGAAVLGVAALGAVCLFSTKNRNAGGYEILPSS